MYYILLRHCELSDRKYDFCEKPLAFDTYAEAKKAQKEWYDFLADYPCDGGAVILVPVHSVEERGFRFEEN